MLDNLGVSTTPPPPRPWMQLAPLDRKNFMTSPPTARVHGPFLLFPFPAKLIFCRFLTIKFFCQYCIFSNYAFLLRGISDLQRYLYYLCRFIDCGQSRSFLFENCYANLNGKLEKIFFFPKSSEYSMRSIFKN